jgi:hypothetical protein
MFFNTSRRTKDSRWLLTGCISFYGEVAAFVFFFFYVFLPSQYRPNDRPISTLDDSSNAVRLEKMLSKVVWKQISFREQQYYSPETLIGFSGSRETQ